MASFLKVKNRATSDLSNAVSASAVSWVVDDSTKFPTTYPFHLTCENEIVEVTNNDTGTNTLTVIRAKEGTTASTHASGKEVRLNITAEIISQLQDGSLLGRLANAETVTGKWKFDDKIRFNNRIFFTQADEKEYIDSLVDGELDLEATTSINYRIDGTEQVQVLDGIFQPTINNDIDLGTSSLKYKNAYFAGTVTLASLLASANLDIGAYNFRAASLTADGLTPGRLVRAGTAGLLGDATVTESSGALGGITTLGMSGQLTNTLAIGTAPFVITSTTKVANLNSEMVDGIHASASATANMLLALDANLDFNLGAGDLSCTDINIVETLRHTTVGIDYWTETFNNDVATGWKWFDAEGQLELAYYVNNVRWLRFSGASNLISTYKNFKLYSNLYIQGDNNYIYLGAGNDAYITYDGTNMIFTPDAVGTGYMQIATAQPLALVIGKGTAGVDYQVKFDGEAYDGVLTWMEYEDYFLFSDDLHMGDDELIAVDVNSGLTASTTQTQGQGALTAQVNEISTVANDDDTVTLPSAVTGIEIEIINNGANTLLIFPASGDNMGLGVNVAEELMANERVKFVAYDTTNWAKESSTEIIHAEIHDEDNTNAFVINDAGGDFHSYHTNGLVAGDLADWTFDAGGAGTSFPIVSVANSAGSPGTQILVTTTGSHGLAVGDIISQTNLADVAYVGIFEVIATAAATTYEVTAAYTATGTGTMDQAATLTADAVAAGVYSFAYYVSGTSSTNNETVDFQLQNNATTVVGSKVIRKFGTASDFGSLSGGGVVSVANGDKLSLALSNEDSAGNITLKNFTLVLIRL